MKKKSAPACPECGSTHCSVSPWRSDEERSAHAGEQAYRCLACVHRFYVARRRWRPQDHPVVAAVGGGTFVLLIVVVLVTAWWRSGDRPGAPEMNRKTQPGATADAPPPPEPPARAK